MSENKTLNQYVHHLIEKDLRKVTDELNEQEGHIADLEEGLIFHKNRLEELRKKKQQYETVLKTGDATYAEPFLYESPKEFKVRE